MLDRHLLTAVMTKFNLNVLVTHLSFTVITLALCLVVSVLSTSSLLVSPSPTLPFPSVGGSLALFQLLSLPSFPLCGFSPFLPHHLLGTSLRCLHSHSHTFHIISCLSSNRLCSLVCYRGTRRHVGPLRLQASGLTVAFLAFPQTCISIVASSCSNRVKSSAHCCAQLCGGANADEISGCSSYLPASLQSPRGTTCRQTQDIFRKILCVSSSRQAGMPLSLFSPLQLRI